MYERYFGSQERERQLRLFFDKLSGSYAVSNLLNYYPHMPNSIKFAEKKEAAGYWMYAAMLYRADPHERDALVDAAEFATSRTMNDLVENAGQLLYDRDPNFEWSDNATSIWQAFQYAVDRKIEKWRLDIITDKVGRLLEMEETSLKAEGDVIRQDAYVESLPHDDPTYDEAVAELASLEAYATVLIQEDAYFLESQEPFDPFAYYEFQAPVPMEDNWADHLEAYEPPPFPQEAPRVDTMDQSRHFYNLNNYDFNHFNPNNHLDGTYYDRRNADHYSSAQGLEDALNDLYNDYQR